MTRSKDDITVFLVYTSPQSQWPFLHNFIPVPELQFNCLTNALEILLLLILIKKTPKSLTSVRAVNFEEFAAVEGGNSIQQTHGIERKKVLLNPLKLSSYIGIPGIWCNSWIALRYKVRIAVCRFCDFSLGKGATVKIVAAVPR
jgi:hypothetical protein